MTQGLQRPLASQSKESSVILTLVPHLWGGGDTCVAGPERRGIRPTCTVTNSIQHTSPHSSRSPCVPGCPHGPRPQCLQEVGMMLRESGHRKPRPLPASLRPGGGLEPCRTAKDPTPPAAHPPGWVASLSPSPPTHPMKQHAGPGTYTPSPTPTGWEYPQGSSQEGRPS